MNLDIDTLRTFLAVAEHRSFTQAAEVVSRTQSTVSAQIKNLEDRLGFALFERSKRSVALTARGEQLMGYAQSLLALHDEGVRMVTQQPPQGRLRLGLTEYFAPQHMPSILQAFAKAYPGLAMEVTTGVTGVLRKLQKDGELDLVIGRRNVGQQDGELIRRERVHWVASSSFSLTSKAPVALALLPVGCGIRAMALASLAERGRAWRAVYCGPSVLGLQAAVSSHMAVACLTQSAVLPDHRTLGAREGLPRLADSELALFTGPRASTKPMRQMADLLHGYFASVQASAL